MRSPFNKRVTGIILLTIFQAGVLFIFSDRCKIYQESSALSSPGNLQFYHDCNHDGNSELIVIQNYSEGITGVSVFDEGKIIDEWKLEGTFNIPHLVDISDYDHDSVDELFVFTNWKDTLRLNVIDPYNRQIVFFNLPVAQIFENNKAYQYTVSSAGFADVDGDGLDEYFFTINTGYVLKPRASYVFNPSKKQVVSSPDACVNITNPYLVHLPDEKAPFVLFSNSATGNCSPDDNLSDYNSWLVVYTSEMTYKFPPVQIGTYPAQTAIVPFLTGEDKCILIDNNYTGTEDLSDFIALYSYQGIKLKGVEVPDEIAFEERMLFPSIDNSGNADLLTYSGKIYRIDVELISRLIMDFHREITINFNQKLESNGRAYQVILGYNNQFLFFCNQVYKVHAKIEFGSRPGKCYISAIQDNSGKFRFAVDTDNEKLLYRLDISPVYQYWYFILLILSLISWLLFFIFWKVHEFRVLKQENFTNQLSVLQLKSVQNQIDPHFNFNLIESFRNLINEKDTERANFIFDEYSQLLKSTVLNGERIVISLREELDFVKGYLELEQFRYHGKFKYSLNIGQDVDLNLQIPKMLLHIFAENAVKHGIRHLKDREGLISISVKVEGKICLITLTDNGIGLEQAREIRSFSTGRGLEIMSQMLELFEKLNRKRIAYILRERTDESGTEVTIIIPL